MNRSRVLRGIGRGAVVLVALILLLWFSAAHAGQRVTLDLGLFTLRNVPLPFALYGAAILGMAFILLIGLRADLETRRLLQRYRAIAELERAAERVRSSEREAGSPDASEGSGRSASRRAPREGDGEGEGEGRSHLEDARQVAGPE